MNNPFINNLDQTLQSKIINDIKTLLSYEGYEPKEVEEAVENALCSRLSDVSYTLTDSTMQKVTASLSENK